MSKIFRRPMFRGGSTNNKMSGIMSGIQDTPRTQYSNGSTREKLLKIAEEYPSQAADPLGQFLIQGGLNLLSGKGAGKGTLGSLAESYKEPTTNLFKSMAEKNQMEKNLALQGELLDIEQAGKEALLDREIQGRMDLEAGKEKPDPLYETILGEEIQTYSGQPQVATRAAKFKTTKSDDLYKKVGSRAAGVLTFDISDPEQVKANQKLLKKMDGKFVYDPYANNYKKINVQKGVIGQPTTYMDIESINLKEVTNGADTGPVVELTEYQKEILAGIPRYREEQKKLKEEQRKLKKEEQKKSVSDVAEQYKNVPSISEDYL